MTWPKVPKPPLDVALDGRAMAVWHRAYEHACEEGWWSDAFVLGLELLARCVSRYLVLHQHLTIADPGLTDPDGRAALEEMRQTAWSFARRWELISGDPEDGELRPDGLDRDIAELAGVPERVLH